MEEQLWDLYRAGGLQFCVVAPSATKVAHLSSCSSSKSKQKTSLSSQYEATSVSSTLQLAIDNGGSTVEQRGSGRFLKACRVARNGSRWPTCNSSAIRSLLCYSCVQTKVILVFRTLELVSNNKGKEVGACRDEILAK